MKIRFIEECTEVGGEPKMYFIEEKTWRGWKRLRYHQGGMSGSIYYDFTNKDKKELLLEVLNHKKRCLKFTNITEYPSLKEYKLQ